MPMMLSSLLSSRRRTREVSSMISTLPWTLRPHHAVLPAVTGDCRHLLHDLPGDLLFRGGRIDLGGPADLELMLKAAEFLLARLDRVLTGLDLEARTRSHRARRYSPSPAQECRSAGSRQRPLEAKVRQLERRLERDLGAKHHQRDEALGHAQSPVRVAVG